MIEKVSRAGIPNALSVDVEEYYHATIVQEAMRGRSRSNLVSRVHYCVDRILRLLDEYQAGATFFVVGEVAQAHSKMVLQIHNAGHEIASHGYSHELVSNQTPDEFRADIRRSKMVLEDLIGKGVVGYRAASCSIGRDQSWAYDILLEEGFSYDSSIYPILHDRYGDIRAPRFPYIVRRNGSAQLIEFPIGTARLCGINLPIGGGGFFRLLPLATFVYGIRRVNLAEGKPVLFYFHPWEMDPGQPRARMPWYQSVRTHTGIRRQEAKLARLFSEFRFCPVRDFLADH